MSLPFWFYIPFYCLFFFVYLITCYYEGLLKRSGNNYSSLVVKRLINNGLLYLNRSAYFVIRPNNIAASLVSKKEIAGSARFFSSDTTMHIVQHTEQDLIKLEPWFVTGFTDGEGNFSFSITQNNNRPLNVKFFFW